MNPILRNILAVLAGIVLGSIVNMGLITLGPGIIPPPAGVDPTDMESLKTNAHLFNARHFIFPFLAHALGAFAGAFLAAKLAASHQMKFAIGLGVWFLLGGIAAVVLFPFPMWFEIFDLVAAYLPMAWLAGKLAGSKNAIS